MKAPNLCFRIVTSNHVSFLLRIDPALLALVSGDLLECPCLYSGGLDSFLPVS